MYDLFHNRRYIVIRRIGGLENAQGTDVAPTAVIRRIGGLEIQALLKSVAPQVIRRIGGLEKISPVSLVAM